MADKEQSSSISQSRSIEEMADFWDTHDATDYNDQAYEVTVEFDLRTRRHYVAIDPDLRDMHTSASGPPGEQEMPGFQPKERHSQVGIKRTAFNQTGRAIDATRQIDCKDGRPALIDPFDQLAQRARNSARETCTEQRVDDEIRIWRNRIGFVGRK